MANTESIREIAHSRTPLSTWFGVVLLFVFFGVLVLAVIGPMPRGSDYEEVRAKKRFEKLKTVRDDAEKALNTYAWIDKNKGVAQIPISRAMELTVADLAKQKPMPAGPIATPPQEQAAAASPAPAGSAKPGAAQPAGSPSAAAPATSAAPAAQPAGSRAAQQAASPSSATQTSPAAANSTVPTSPTPAQTP